MDKTEIINLALQFAEQTPIASTDQSQYDKIYNLYLGNIIRNRPFLWAHDILMGPFTQDASESTMDLGYKYKYTINSDVKEILDINRDSLLRQAGRYRSREEALDFGIVFPDDVFPPDRGKSDFAFVGGVLHSDVEVTSILVSKTISATVMPEEAQLLLAHTLGTFFAKTITRKQDVIARCKMDENEAWVNATRETNKPPANQHLIGLYEWLNEFYSQTRANRNYN